MQLALFELESSWKPPDMSTLPNWTGCPRVGLDIETYDPNLKTTGPSVRTGGHIAGVSVALEDGPCFYLPIRHQGGGNVNEAQALKYLRNMGSEYKGTLVGANLSYDLDFLAERGIVFSRLAWQRDVMVADPLLNELHPSYTLDAIGKRWGFEGKDESLLRAAARQHKLNPKADMHKLPAKYVGAYAEWDARLPLEIIAKQETAIDEDGLRQVYDLECKVQPVLLAMKRHGVRIDLNQLERVEQWAIQEERKALDTIKHSTGVKVHLGDVWKKPPLERVLNTLGIKPPRTPKTNQPKIDQELLDAIDHPVGGLILRARKVNKLRTTFAASIRTHMVGDRIHTTFNQLRRTREDGGLVGGRYGRCSSEHPNLQQQPARDEFAKMWRSIYVPDHEGQQWYTADYSQQEPRILVHFAEQLALPGAATAADSYRNDPNADNHQMVADMCGIARKPAKAIFLGLCYGMGGAKLADDLGLPTKLVNKRGGGKVRVAGNEAQALLDRFNHKVPFVKQLASQFEESAREWGYVTTILGRHCRFPQLPDGRFDWCYRAINRLIQGSAGDQTKTAMVAVAEAGLPQQLQVHDELDGSADSPEEAQAVAEVMETCLPLGVPSKVDLALGPSWGEAEE